MRWRGIFLHPHLNEFITAYNRKLSENVQYSWVGQRLLDDNEDRYHPRLDLFRAFYTSLSNPKILFKVVNVSHIGISSMSCKLTVKRINSLFQERTSFVGF